MVSVSRRAGPPHVGHVVCHEFLGGRQRRPALGGVVLTSGNTTGNWSSGTATMPHFSQCTIGIGQPQYRWREISQSRRR